MKILLKRLIRAICPYGIWVALQKWKASKKPVQKNVLYLDEKEINTFCKYFLKTKENAECYFEIAGAKLPDIRNYPDSFYIFVKCIFQDTFLFPYFLNDNYDKSYTDIMDIHMIEGPYGYKDGNFNVSIKKGDVVMDIGAWIGDFSAYSSSKGAITYAFEPVTQAYELLQKTAKLNIDIYPVKKGLSDKTGEVSINISQGGHVSNQINNADVNRSIVYNDNEIISITTLDEFVKENKISKIDFIKADIEGEERNMLKGASWVLKNYAPKLAICTYHNPEDPKLLEKIILEANPKYKIVHLKHKLFAQVLY
jgi:FkbM family methyltransferase